MDNLELLNDITSSNKVKDFVSAYNDNNSKIKGKINEIVGFINDFNDQKTTLSRSTTQLLKIDNKYNNVSNQVKELTDFMNDVKSTQPTSEEVTRYNEIMEYMGSHKDENTIGKLLEDIATLKTQVA